MAQSLPEIDDEQGARLDQPRIGNRLGFRHTHNPGLGSSSIPMVEHSCGLDMRVLETQVLRRPLVTEMGEGDTPREAPSLRVESHGPQIFIDFGTAIRSERMFP